MMLSQLKNHAEIHNLPLFTLITLKILNTIFSVLLCCFFSVQMQGLLISCFDIYFTSQLSCIKRPQHLDLKRCVNFSGFIAGSLVFRPLVKAC